MTAATPGEIDRVIGALARRHGGALVAALAGRYSDVALADDAVQDALVEAWQRWPDTGVPDNPPGWLTTVAHRKALDRLRRTAAEQRRVAAVAPEVVARGADVDHVRPAAGEPGGAEGEVTLVRDEGQIRDDQLRLLLLCTHPALHRDAQVALTLRLVGGLSTSEVAAAFLVPETTMAQRIVRAKHKIRTARIPLTVPADLTGRLDVLLTVLYLVFNEGYLAHGTTGPLRVDLLAESVRLTELLAGLLPDRAEVGGLLALQWFTRSRETTRFTGDGDLVTLDRQDRTRWDRTCIDRGNRVLTAALRRAAPGPFQVRALIAGEHANARTAADTDWPAIVRLYRQLVAMTGSPVERLNLAVATAEADGAPAGLAVLATISGLDRYHLFHAAAAELALRAGDAAAAAASFDRALELVTAPAEQRHLARRLAVARAGVPTA
ncbi:RNA polymerase sigma factor [Nakamurella leprariae]|uniref:Sigma-70 family RNA polymerase sigma factor n=1 Tax=Nakamurella leprariae TaxID=2803911 RepID=A0A938YH40_9ACTN|nr:sigma-70 family RNA polymerase sigma factor [Nakamurella leprariae]MBM9469498.1 sigma-70 family RNA polymerase sigma factor [Nakamurella leprariae]